MYIADRWKTYEILDTGNGEKLERWGSVVLSRPDPQVIWPCTAPNLWDKADAVYHRSSQGGGAWSFRHPLPDQWQISYGSMNFLVHPTNFKHTGLFPEQAVNWDWMQRRISFRRGDVPRVLNLFAYTGGATIACASAGAHVTHVDAAKGMVAWAKNNCALNTLPENHLRYIVEDALGFVRREIRRGSRYDAILMDPPSYGRGPSGEIWKIEKELYPLVELCVELLSDHPLFLIINSYTTGLQPAVLYHILHCALVRKRGGHAEADEVVLPVASGGILPCGACGRWSPEEI